jgi:hypothetical protein
MTFTCYLHKRGVMAPELKVLNCDSKADLPDLILDRMRSWPRIDVIDVYDDDENPIFFFSLEEHWLN